MPIDFDEQPRLTILSFGYLHGPPPEATVTADLRRLLRDPHTDPALRQLTGADPEITARVMATTGAARLLDTLEQLTLAALHAAHHTEPVTVALGCAGGRHRSHVLAGRLAAALRDGGWPVTLTHLHAHLPVITR